MRYERTADGRRPSSRHTGQPGRSAGDDALDLVQETYLKAARSPTSVPLGATSEEAWLVRVLINIRRDQWRQTAVRKRHDPGA